MGNGKSKESQTDKSAPEGEKKEVVLGLKLRQAGGRFDTTRENLCPTGGTFASSNARDAKKLVDKKYGNGFWSPDKGRKRGGKHFVGLRLGASRELDSIAWSRDNSGQSRDNCLGTFEVQISQASFANHCTPNSAWKTVEKLVYTKDFPSKQPHMRHCFEFKEPVTCAAVRLVVPEGTVLDQFEVYAPPEGLSRGQIASTQPFLVVDQFAALKTNNRYGDVVVRANNGQGMKFRIHSHVLASASTFFSRMFFGREVFQDQYRRIAKEAEEKKSEDCPKTLSKEAVAAFREHGGKVRRLRKGGWELTIPENDTIVHAMMEVLYYDKISCGQGLVPALIPVARFYELAKLLRLCVRVLEVALDHDNCVALFNDALDLTGDPSYGLAFMAENITDIMEKEQFLDLRSDRLATLASYDPLTVDEEDLFNGCLQWATAQVTRSGGTPSPEARRQVLKPILKFIRFPLMERQFVASTVWESGLLEKKEMLELMTYFAVDGDPKKFKKSMGYPMKNMVFSDQPRTGCAVVSQSSILAGKDAKHMRKILGELRTAQMKLLYSSIKFKDALTANAFRSKCNNQGPTFVVIETVTGCVFGGYNDTPWSNASSYGGNNRCFLWRLKRNKDTYAPTRYNASSQSSFTYNNSGYGPTWGGGHDLYCSGTFNSTSNYASPSTYRQVAPGFPSETITSGTISGGVYNFNVRHMEVFTVKKRNTK